MQDWYAKARNMKDVEETLDFLHLMPNSEVSFPQYFDPYLDGCYKQIDTLCRMYGVKYINNVLMRCFDGVILINKPTSTAKQYLRRYKLKLEDRGCQILSKIGRSYEELRCITNKPFWSLQPEDWAYLVYVFGKAESPVHYIDAFREMYSNGLSVNFPSVQDATDALWDQKLYLVHPQDISFMNYRHLNGIVINEMTTPSQLIDLAKRHNKDVVRGTGENHVAS